MGDNAPTNDAPETAPATVASSALGGAAPPKPPPAAHLAPHKWKKGQSGNPGGRPKGRTVTAALRELATTEHNGKPLVDLLAERLMKEALSGKFTFAKEVIERLDGKVVEKSEIKTQGEQKVYVCPPPRVIGTVKEPVSYTHLTL